LKLHVNCTDEELALKDPLIIASNWRATVRYFQKAFAAPYAEFTYVTSNGQFNLVQTNYIEDERRDLKLI
jgi:hypothetical protein